MPRRYPQSLSQKKGGSMTTWICVILIVVGAAGIPTYIKFAENLNKKAQAKKQGVPQPSGFQLTEHHWWGSGESSGNSERRLLYFTSIDRADVLLLARIPRDQAAIGAGDPTAEIYRYEIAEPKANPLSIDVFEPAPGVRMQRSLSRLLEMSESPRGGSRSQNAKRGKFLRTLTVIPKSTDKISVDDLQDFRMRRLAGAASDDASKAITLNRGRGMGSVKKEKEAPQRRASGTENSYETSGKVTYFDSRKEEWDAIGFRYEFGSAGGGTDPKQKGGTWQGTFNDNAVLHFSAGGAPVEAPIGDIRQIWTEVSNRQIWNVELKSGEVFNDVKRSYPPASKGGHLNPVHVELIGRKSDGKLATLPLFTSRAEKFSDEDRGDFVERIAFQ